MKSGYRLFVACLAMMFAFSLAPQFEVKVLAEDTPAPDPDAPQGWRHGPPPGLERFRKFADRLGKGAHRNTEELTELIELVGAWRMMKEVGLSEEQTLRALELGRELKTQSDKIRKQRAQALRELKKLLDDPDTKDEVIAKQLRTIERMDEKQRKLVRGFEERIRSGLTVRQQAKHLLFKTRFHGDIRRRIEDIRRKHAGTRRGKPREGRQPPPHPGTPSRMPPPPTETPAPNE